MQKYLIKDKKGRIFGPYTQQEIAFYIDEKEFQGEEMFSLYPTGKWKPLSAHPLFYKKLIQRLNPSRSKDSSEKELSLSENILATNDSHSENSEDFLEPTRILSPPKEESKKQKRKIRLSKEFKEELLEEEGFEDIVEMETDFTQVFSPLSQSLKTPVLVAIALVALLLCVFLIFSDKETGNQNLSVLPLLAPQKPAPALAPKDRSQQEKSAFLDYLKSSNSHYLSSQKTYIKLLESQPQSPKLYMMLCLNHLELWPFSNQSTKEQSALNKVLNLSRQYDKSNTYSEVCHLVQAFIAKDFEKVLIISNRLLSQSHKNTPSIYLFYIKAKTLKALKMNKEAHNLLDSVRILNPQWLAPVLEKADLYYQNRQYSLATQHYQKALSLFKKHPIAGLRLGVLEYKYFKKGDKSRKTLESILLTQSAGWDPYILFEAYITLAKIYIQANKEDLAQKYSHWAYSLYPQHPEVLKLQAQLQNPDLFKNTKIQSRALIYKGDLLVSQGNCAQALKNFNKAYEISREGLSALKIGECYWQSGRTGQAIRWLKKAINADPQLLSAYFTLSKYLSQIHDFETAKNILDTAKQQLPSHTDIFKAYAQLSYRQKLYNQTLAYSERALKFYTYDVDIYVLMSRSFLALGKQAQAYSYAKKAIAINPNDIPAQISYALVLDSTGQNPDTETYFKQMIENFPSIIEYQQALGEYYFAKGELEQAQSLYEEMITKNPNFKPAYISLARTHNQLFLINRRNNQHQALAVKYFRAASLLDLSDPQPLFYKAQLHLDNEEYLRAQKEYEKILHLNPRYPKIHYYIGLSLFYQGGVENLDKALKMAQTESEKNPKDYRAYKLAGDIYFLKTKSAFAEDQERQKTYLLCATSYQKALKYLKRDFESSIGLLKCYKGAGNLDKAIHLAHQMKEQGLSGYPELYKELGSIYEAKQEYEKANSFYQSYFQLKPGASDRKAINERIQKLLQAKRSLSESQ